MGLYGVFLLTINGKWFGTMPIPPTCQTFVAPLADWRCLAAPAPAFVAIEACARSSAKSQRLDFTISAMVRTSFSLLVSLFVLLKSSNVEQFSIM